jgi:acetyl-CoA synthetase/acetyltransferase
MRRKRQHDGDGKSDRADRIDPPSPSPRPLDAFAAHAVVALVGASPDSYWTGNLLRNLALAGRPGPRLFTVHPKRRRVGRVPCVASLDEAPAPPDLAFLLAPAEEAPRLLGEAAAAGARAAVVLADPPDAGPGDPIGTIRAIARAARETGLVVLGPSSLGFLSPAHGSFPFAGRLLERPPSGTVGLVSESGAVAVELLRAPLAPRIGFSHLVAVGEGAGFGAAAACEALVEDPATAVVAAYVERLDDPDRWVAAAERAHRLGKGIVLLRGARETSEAREAFRRAAPTRPEFDLSTGGSEARLAGFLRHAGIPEVPTLEALVETLALLVHRTPPRGRRAGVVSLSAGAGRLAADALRAGGFTLAGRPPDPPNPLDLTGRAVENAGAAARRIRAFAESPAFDVVVLATQPPRGREPSDRRIASWVEALARGAGSDRLGLAVHLFHGPLPEAAANPGRPGNPFLAGLSETVAALQAAVRLHEARLRIDEPIPPFPEIDAGAAGAPLLGPPRVLSEPASLELFRRYGLPLPRWLLCTTATAAARFARDVGGPVAVKAASPDIPGKRAERLVHLDVDGDAAVRAAFHDVTLRAGRLVRPERLLGAVVMERVEGAARVIAGVVRDPRLGMLVVARRDDLAGSSPPVAVRRAPLPPSAALDMAADLGFPADAPDADAPALADALVRLGRLGHDLGAVVAAAVAGPLLLRPRGGGCAVVDAAVALRPPPIEVDAAPDAK